MKFTSIVQKLMSLCSTLDNKIQSCFQICIRNALYLRTICVVRAALDP